MGVSNWAMVCMRQALVWDKIRDVLFLSCCTCCSRHVNCAAVRGSCARHASPEKAGFRTSEITATQPIATLPNYFLRCTQTPDSPQRCLHTANMADKLRAQQQLEAQQARFIGIGSADTNKFEWMSNMQRDSLASYIGHPPLLQYMSIGLGQPREVTRVQLLERMIRPVGPPPEVSAAEEAF
jgi:splicing factor 3B subunit 5